MNRFFKMMSKFPVFWRIAEVPAFCILLALAAVNEQRYIPAVVWIALGVFRGITEYMCDSTENLCKCKA